MRLPIAHLGRSLRFYAAFASLLTMLAPIVARSMPAENPGLPAPLALADGEWQGVVVFDGGPVRFSLDVDHRLGPATPVRIGCASRTAELPTVRSQGAQVQLTIDPGTGERLEGSVLGDSFVGYYHAPEPQASQRTFPFRAKRVAADASASASDRDFGGEWIFLLRSADGRTRTVTALIGQGREKLHAIWREADGTRRYLSGLPGSNRLLLQELAHGPALIAGRSDPVTGVIRGELIEPAGRTAFTAARRTPRRIINLTGLD